MVATPGADALTITLELDSGDELWGGVPPTFEIPGGGSYPLNVGTTVNTPDDEYLSPTERPNTYWIETLAAFISDEVDPDDEDGRTYREACKAEVGELLTNNQVALLSIIKAVRAIATAREKASKDLVGGKARRPTSGRARSGAASRRARPSSADA